MARIGLALLVGGILALVGYLVWAIYRYLTISLPLKVIVTVIVAGFLLILASVARERIRQRGEERFEEEG